MLFNINLNAIININLAVILIVNQMEPNGTKCDLK